MCGRGEGLLAEAGEILPRGWIGCALQHALRIWSWGRVNIRQRGLLKPGRFAIKSHHFLGHPTLLIGGFFSLRMRNEFSPLLYLAHSRSHLANIIIPFRCRICSLCAKFCGPIFLREEEDARRKQLCNFPRHTSSSTYLEATSWLFCCF